MKINIIMIHCTLRENTNENRPSNISLVDIIKECNDKIIKEKEKLYNFKFSSHLDLDPDQDQVITDNKINEPLEKFKEEKKNVNNDSCSEDIKNQTKNDQKETSNVPNIFKQRVKSFFKKKNLN